MIKLYGFEECKPCRQVKRLLKKFDVEFEYIDVLKKNIDFVAVPILELENGEQLMNLNSITKYLRELRKKQKVKFRIKKKTEI